VTSRYTEVQLDALRELSNVASGTAATALSQMLGREVDISVPHVVSLPTADAVEACGEPDSFVSGVVIPVEGDMAALVLLLIPSEHAQIMCGLLGVQAGSHVGDSALREIGNVLGTSYLGALATMTGLELLPCPPDLATDMLGAIVASVLAQTAAEADTALVLDSNLVVADEACSLSFLLLPTRGSAGDLLAPLGLAGPSN
jgi:chemotaxis protein CheC